MTSTMPSLIDKMTPFYRGFIDSANFIGTAKMIKRSSRIKKFVYKTVPLYSVFMLINFAYSLWYHPYVLSSKSLYSRALITGLWWGLWFIPSYIVCKLLYYYQFMELWDTVYSKRKSSEKNKITNKDSNMWTSISELIYGIVLSTAYFVQTVVLEAVIPIQAVRMIFSNIAFSWMISWGVFEYKLIYEGKDLFQRIRYFERRWLYFLGFGLPISVLYTCVFDWYTGMNVWYPIVMLLSFRAILSNPVKSPKPEEPDLNTENTENELPRQPGRRPKPKYDHRRLRIFFIAEYISTVTVRWFIQQRNRHIKME